MEPFLCALPHPQATHQLGIQLGQLLTAGSVLLLEGDLGSGKTTLVQGIAAGLGITEAVVSPTFILLNEYPEGRLPLYHLDLYRLQPKEVEALYLENYWEGTEVPLGVVAIEWAERLSQRPSSYLQIRITSIEQGRQLELLPVGSAAVAWLSQWGDRLLTPQN